MKGIIEALMEALKLAFDILLDFFDSDINHVMSKEARRIFAHKEDRQKYIDAVDRIMSGSQQETIILHTGESVTLIG